MALDLGGGYGAEGAVQGLQQLLAQRQAMRAYADQQQQQQTDNAFKQQQLAQQDALTRASIAERLQAAQGVQSERQYGVAQDLADTIPKDTRLPMTDPAIGAMQVGGTGSLLTPQPEVPAQGPAFQGPTQPGISQENMMSGLPAGMLKTASSKQQEDAAKLAEKAANDANNLEVRNWMASIAQGRADQGPKEPTPHFSVQQGYDSDGKPSGLVRINTLTGEVSPVPGNSTVLKPPPRNPQAERQTTLSGYAAGDTDEALKQVAAAEKAALLGPGVGRLYGQFLAGTVGSTGNPQADAQLGSLKQALGTLNMSYPPAISGSVRGAGAMDRLKQTLNSDKFSSDLLRGALTEMQGALGRRAPGAAATGAKPNQIHYNAAGEPIQP